MSSILFNTFATFVLLLIFSSHLPFSSALCNKDDEKALLAFKNSFTYNPFPTWATYFECCDWYGVDCDDTTGRLYGLNLIDELNGTIPSSIGDFPTLQVLRLHKLAGLVGPIPPQITNLKKLRFLTISWTSISGPVPSFLSELPDLQSLDLSFNNLSGPIPASLGDNPKLTAIDISRNHVTGTIPASLFHKAKDSFPSIVLSHNSLTGEIPRSFGDVAFQSIDLSRNHLTGDASFLFGRSKPADQIDLSRNQLEFNLTEVEFPVKDLAVLDLNHNMIHGSIPAQITEVGNLQFFNVSYNRLCGEIPSGGRMGEFDEYCFLHNECLCGAPLLPCK